MSRRSSQPYNRSNAWASLALVSHDMILIDELHRHGSLGVGQGLMGGLQIGCPPIYHYGSEELQQRVLPDILSGKKRLCLAITEPEVCLCVCVCPARKERPG